MHTPIGALGLECLMDRANIFFTSGYRFVGEIDLERLRASFFAVANAVEKFSYRLHFKAQNDFSWQPVGGFGERFRVVQAQDIGHAFTELCRNSLASGHGDGHVPMVLCVLVSTRGDGEFIIAQTSEHTYLDARSAEFLFNSMVDHYNAAMRGDQTGQEEVLARVRSVRTIDSGKMLEILGLEEDVHNENLQGLGAYAVDDPGRHAIPLKEVPQCLETYRQQRFAPIIRFFPLRDLLERCRRRYPEVTQNSVICAALVKGFYEANRQARGLPEAQKISFKMLSDLLSPELRAQYTGNYIAFVPVTVDGHLAVEDMAKQINDRIREFKTKKIDVSLFRAVEDAVDQAVVGTVDDPLSFVVTNWNNYRFLDSENFLHGTTAVRHQSGVNIDPRDVLGAVLVNRPILVINLSRKDEVCLSFFPSLRAEAENLEVAEYIGGVFE